MQRLGRNIGRYFGETIVLPEVLRDVAAAAQQHGWRSEVILQNERMELTALHRVFGVPRKKVYISAGIHGDEPAGPLAVRQLLQENSWPAGLEVWICPCLNPTGFALNTRENHEGLDLNRQYLRPKAEEVVAHIAWLNRQPRFDLTLLLHEDWESHGFYIYELNPQDVPSFAEKIVEAVGTVCHVDQSAMIEGRPAQSGIIRPNVDPASRPDWPEAFFMMMNKTPLAYTLEAPSDFPLGVRVNALVAGVRAALACQLLKSAA